MIDKENESELVDSPSRRSFLGAGSAVLAATALVGLTASAQERENTLKAERDQSSSNPGPENTPLLAENPNSNTPPPTDHGDIGPIWYSFDLARKRIGGRRVDAPGNATRTASFNRSRRRQHASHSRQLPRIALAYGR